MSEFLIEKFDLQLENIFSTYIKDKQLKDLCSYTCLNSGKRLRPKLAWILCDLLGVTLAEEKLYSILSPIELIHASSLIHDDLPAIDNDDFRRGKASCHKVFGEGAALLGADFLIAFIARIINQYASSKDQIAEILSTLLISYENICLGQLLDIKKSEKKLDDLLNIFSLKTASLFETSTRLAGILNSENQEISDILGRIGHNFGILFQIENDLLDCLGNETEMGRKESSDLKNGKISKFCEISSSSVSIVRKFYEELNIAVIELIARVKDRNKSDIKTEDLENKEKLLNEVLFSNLKRTKSFYSLF